MSPRSLLRGVPAIFVLGSGFAVLSQTPGQPISTTYILSQAICLASPPAPPEPLKEGCMAQTIPAGATVEFQLPGGPSMWRESSVSSGLRRSRPPQIIGSPGRIPGTEDIYQFRYMLLPGSAGSTQTITFTENPPFLSKPVGKLTFTIISK
jgi:hypothetical protein